MQTSSKNLILVLFLFLLNPIISIGQMSYGEYAIGGNKDDYGYSVIQSKDGGYAICGYTDSYVANLHVSDVYIIKMDSNGNLEWTKSIDENMTNIGYSIIQTHDGGYAFTGYSAYGPGGSSVYFVKLNASGNLSSTKLITNLGYETGQSLVQCTDGGYAITGQTYNAGFPIVYVVKLDSTGNISWTKAIGISYDLGLSIIQAHDGGFVIGGYTTNYGAGGYDAYVVKLDSLGNKSWAATIGGTKDDFCNSIIQSRNGDYVMAGYTGSYGAGSYDVYAVKLSPSGNLIWTKTIGGTSDDEGESIVQTKDGGYAIGGYTNSYGAGDYDAYLIKLDSSGNLSWTKAIGGTGSDQCYSIKQTRDGGYALVGITNSYGSGNYDVFFIKTDSTGNTCMPEGSGGSVSSGGMVHSGYTAGNGGTIGTGGTVSTGGTYTAICNVLITGDAIDNFGSKFTLYPDPSSGNFSLGGLLPGGVAELYNELGQEMQHKVADNGSTVNFNISSYPNGVYLIRIRDKNGSFLDEKKIMKME